MAAAGDGHRSPSEWFRRFATLASAALGDRERAFALIEELYRTRSLELLSLKGDPAWDDLRGDPRFRELLQRFGLT